MDEKRKLKVFLCHASQDKPIIRELSLRLAENDWIDPWLDEKKLLPGEDWRTSIEVAVEAADLVVICLSKNSVRKEGFVQKELRYAKEISLEKPEGAIFLIPLRLDECDVPRGLRFLQWTNYFGDDKEEHYLALLEALNFRYTQVIHRGTNPYPIVDNEPRLYQNLYPISEALSDYWDHVDELSNLKEETLGIQTGFRDVDKVLNGMHAGELLILTSFPNNGRFSFLSSIIANIILRQKKRLAVFSLGRSKYHLIQHIIVQETGIDPNNLRTGRLKEIEKVLFAHATEVFMDTSVYIDNSPLITPSELLAKCRRLHREDGLDLVIVDNLFFIKDEKSSFSPKGLNYLTLKSLAQELNIPVLASVELAEIPQKVTRKNIPQSVKQEYSFFKEIADTILFVFKHDTNKKDENIYILQVTVDKQNTETVENIGLTCRQVENTLLFSPTLRQNVEKPDSNIDKPIEDNQEFDDSPF